MAPSYRFGKGPIVAALEKELRDRQKFDALYDDLVRVLDDIEAERETTFVSDFKTSLDTDARNHLDNDVFGKQPKDTTSDEEGAERRRVYYDGLKRAMELARELGASGAPAPIEIFWGCGQAFNECWISWDKAGGSGVTLFVLSTAPAIGGHGADDPPGTMQATFPGTDPEEKGLYVVRAAGPDGTTVFQAGPDIGV
jgi:hypothetical protein